MRGRTARSVLSWSSGCRGKRQWRNDGAQVGANVPAPRSRADTFPPPNGTPHGLAHQSGDLIALITLTTLEVVLGIDNVIFISILASRLPEPQQRPARRLGLVAAMITRLLLLLSLTWIMRLTTPLFAAFGQQISGRDLILVAGGLFLLAKATHEIHDKLEGEAGHANPRGAASFGGVVLQIMLLDVVFSLDSVVTAVGMVDVVWVMATAIVIAVGIMLVSVETIAAFVERHPTVKMLALSFLLLIGLSLVAEGFDHEIPKGYLYFAMGFSVFVEMLNQKARRRRPPPVDLRRAITEG
ncbi:MAG: TerC family protein [Myxococcales bacterium]|nr:TerC family protein [Myxococcales bacterium]